MENIQPVNIEWATFGTLGIAGKTGSGKSSTMRLILSQFAMDTCGIIIADGHGKMQGSLASSVNIISPALIIPPVIEFNDILKTVYAFESIMDDRVTGKDTASTKIALVIDEFTSFFRHMTKEQIRVVSKILLGVSNEARKTNLRVIFAAHNWAQDYIGSASIRSSIGTMIFHNLDQRESNLFFPQTPKLRNTISSLRQGEAIVKQINNDPCKVAVPYVSMDDLEHIKSFVSNSQPFRDMYGYKFNSIHPVSTKISHDDVINKILELRVFEGKSKQHIIWQLFHVKPGSSPKYKAASKLFDLVMKKYGEL